jgi:CRP-like cAMP-binding protein
MEIEIEKYHLKSKSFFDFVSNEDELFLKNKLIRQEFQKSKYLFKENSFSKGVYIIRKGKVKIFQTNKEGKQSIVYIYKKGDYFGYRPLLSGEPHPVSAVAMDNVVVSFIPRELFNQILTKSSNFARKLLINLSQEFSVWINKMTVFSQYSVKNRVALSLLILNKIYKKENTDSKTKITISRDDFAGFVGTAKETLVRTLRIFKDEEIIVTKGTTIIILKPRTLLKLITQV